jgi:hypothetical protein
MNLQAVTKESVMSEDARQHLDTNSAEFKEGLEAGLNSKEDSKNWQAGNKLGQKLKDEGEKRESMSERLCNDSTSLPVKNIPKGYKANLNIPKGYKGNLQDEKDETEE